MTGTVACCEPVLSRPPRVMQHPATCRKYWGLARDPDELEEDEAPATEDTEGQRRFLEAEVLPWLETRKREIAKRPLIRDQAFGETLDPDKLEPLGRYEIHLDRKLERMLTMLLRLKEIRKAPRPADPFGKTGSLVGILPGLAGSARGARRRDGSPVAVCSRPSGASLSPRDRIRVAREAELQTAGSARRSPRQFVQIAILPRPGLSMLNPASGA
jgi:hypothetical protein